MALMSAIPFQRAAGHTHPFRAPNPIGCVLHKTESSSYEHTRDGFLHGPYSPHFLVGQQEGQVIQLLDTQFRGTHVELANDFYLGIEFYSHPSRRGYEHKQDPKTIREDLTPYKVSIGRDIVSWISAEHNIPMIGAPSLKEMRDAHGRWSGFCNHADVSATIPGHSQHGEGLLDADFISLAIWPKDSRQGMSNLGDWLSSHPDDPPSPQQKAMDDWIQNLGRSVQKSK
jgi:hypothetical protein